MPRSRRSSGSAARGRCSLRWRSRSARSSCLGAFVQLFEGLKLLVSNWRLTLVQILPAMWVWLAMLDLKAHVLHGRDVPGLVEL
jgi:hypothetical protein